MKWIYSYRPMYLVDEDKYIKNETVTILVYAK
jgi:hypothetical protein